MHLNGEIVEMPFEGKTLEDMGKWAEDLRCMILKNFGPQGLVCTLPGSI